MSKILKSASFNRGPLHRNDRVGALHRAWGHVFTNHLVGDYFEFGVYKGGSFISSIEQYRVFRAWLESELNSKEIWRREVAENYSNTPPLNSLVSILLKECL